MTDKTNTKTLFKFWFITIEKWLNKDVLSIDFKAFWIRISKILGIYLYAKITKFISLEIQLDSGNNDTYFETSIGRYGDHYLFTLQSSLYKLISFNVFLCDDREWDYYKGKRTYKISDYYDETPMTYPVGTKPCFKRRRQKAKWFLNTQHLKIYNFDWLNNPWGLTFDFAWFPLLIYTKFSFGVDKYYWSQFNFEVSKHMDNALKVNFRLNFLSRFIEFEIGKNTVIREANTYFYDDFRTLEVFNADINHVGEGACSNAIVTQVINKNLPYLYALLEWHKFDFNKINTDEILEYSASKGTYRKEIFELVTKHINYIKNWEKEIEPYVEDLEPVAYEKLLELKNNPVPEQKNQNITEKQSITEWIKKHFRVSFDKNLRGFDWLIWLKGVGYNSFRFNWRGIDEHDYESNFQLSLTRDFWIRNYLLTQFRYWKQLSIKISSNNVYPLSIDSNIFGILQIFNIGARTEDPFYNYKKQRLMTSEEYILKHHLNKSVDTAEPNKRRKKYKEFYNSKFVKIYNNNYLCNPYGRAIEFNLPFNLYLKLSFNHLHYDNYKNETNLEFTFNFDEGNSWCDKHKFLRINLSAFKHYFKVVLGKNTITRHSIIHSDKSLARITDKKFQASILNRLFQDEIKPHETWIYKKIVEKGIDLSELDFNKLIYDLAWNGNYHKATLDYILQVAKDNDIRFCIDEDYENSANGEIIKALQDEYSSDFEESVLNQLVEYVEQQEDVTETNNSTV